VQAVASAGRALKVQGHHSLAVMATFTYYVGQLNALVGE
jgi:hypothetical protein